MALFCANGAASAPWLRWAVSVAEVTGAIETAVIDVGAQPWVTSLGEARDSSPPLFWLMNTNKVRIQQGAIACGPIQIKLNTQWLGGNETTELLAGQMAYGWLTLSFWLALASVVLLIAEWLRLMMGSLRAALWAGLALVGVGLVAITVLALLGPSTSVGVMPSLFYTYPECHGSLTLQARLAGVETAGPLWLALSFGCGLGALVALGLRFWPQAMRRPEPALTSP